MSSSNGSSNSTQSGVQSWKFWVDVAKASKQEAQTTQCPTDSQLAKRLKQERKAKEIHEAMRPKSEKEQQKEAQKMTETRSHYLEDEDCVDMVAAVLKDIFELRRQILSNPLHRERLNGPVHSLLSHPNLRNVGARFSTGGFDLRFDVEGNDSMIMRTFCGITNVLRDRFYPEDDDINTNDYSDMDDEYALQNVWAMRAKNSTGGADTSLSSSPIPNRRTSSSSLRNSAYKEYNKLRKFFRSHNGAGVSKRDNYFLCPVKAGIEHGSTVHSQVEKFVEICMPMCRRDEGTDEDKIIRERARQFVSSINHSKFFDFCTLRALSKLVELKLVPIAAEYKIYDPIVCVATSIDLICVDAEHCDIVPIELKTGYESQLYTPLEPLIKGVSKESMQDVQWDKLEIPRFQGGLGQIEDCPFNRHMLQILFSVIVLNKFYVDQEQKQEPPIHKAYVLRVCPRGETSEAHLLPRDIQAIDEIMYNSIYQHQQIRGHTKRSPYEFNNFQRISKAIERKKAARKQSQHLQRQQSKELQKMGIGVVSGSRTKKGKQKATMGGKDPFSFLTQ